MGYRCVCPDKPYLAKKLTLCRKCTAKYGDNFRALPLHVRLEYDRLNNGGDYEFSSLNKQGVPITITAEPMGKKGADVKGVEDPTFWEKGRKQCPICHDPIKVSERLCHKCFTELGKDKTKWPEWLQHSVTDDQRIIDAARNHREGSINDETFMNGPAAGSRTVARHNQNEISTDTLNWGDDELNSPGTTNPAGGPIAGDRLGHKYNAIAWQGDSDQYKGLPGSLERDYIEDKIAAEQELNLWNPIAAAVLLLYHNGHNQSEIAELMKIRQQMVSEILRKAVKRG